MAPGPNSDHLPDLVAGRLAKSVGRGRDQAAATDGTWGGLCGLTALRNRGRASYVVANV